MVCYKELYGADADGNRGMTIINAEIEESDSDEIRTQLEMMHEPGIDNYTITLYCDMFDTNHEFEVDINEYFTPTEIRNMT